MYVVEDHRHAVARGLGQADISGNYAFENLGAEKATKVGGYLLRESGPIVIHREQDPLYGERRIDCPAETHESVE
jgi:hypothetical protein